MRIAKKLIIGMIICQLSHLSQGAEVDLIKTNLVKINCNQGQNLEAIIDGVIGGTELWRAPYSPPAWIEIDLGAIKNISRINLFMYWAGKRYYQYYIEGSSDGKTWKILADTRNKELISTRAGYLHMISVPARFIRITFVYNSINSEIHVYEVEIYGNDSE